MARKKNSGGGLRAYTVWFDPPEILGLELDAAREGIRRGKRVTWQAVLRELARERLKAANLEVLGEEIVKAPD